MSTKKITELAAATPPLTVADLVAAVTDPSGTPVTEKVPLGNLPTHMLAAIFVKAGVGTQTPGVSPGVKVTQFTADSLATTNSSPDHTNDRITVNRAGLCFVVFGVSFHDGVGPGTVGVYVRINGADANVFGASALRRLNGVTDIGTTMGVGVLSCSVGDQVELWAYSPDGSTIDIDEAALVVLA